MTAKVEHRIKLQVGADLCLTEILTTDAKQLVYTLQDPVIARWCINVPHSYTTANAKQWIHFQQGKPSDDPTRIWVIRLTNTHQLIGQMGLNQFDSKNKCGEVGYWIDAKHTQKGYATACLTTLMQYWTSKICIQKLFAWVKVGNASSEKVLLSNGFYKMHDKKPCQNYSGKTELMHRFEWNRTNKF